MALTDYEERQEQSAKQERVVEARRALEMERTMRRLQAMAESARTGKMSPCSTSETAERRFQ